LIKKYGDFLDGMHNHIESMLANDLGARSAWASTEQSHTEGEQAEQDGDISKMREYAAEIGSLTRAEYDLKIQLMKQAYEEQIAQAEASRNAIL
jgi:hypothetical protein